MLCKTSWIVSTLPAVFQLPSLPAWDWETPTSWVATSFLPSLSLKVTNLLHSPYKRPKLDEKQQNCSCAVGRPHLHKDHILFPRLWELWSAFLKPLIKSEKKPHANKAIGSLANVFITSARLPLQPNCCTRLQTPLYCSTSNLRLRSSDLSERNQRLRENTSANTVPLRVSFSQFCPESTRKRRRGLRFYITESLASRLLSPLRWWSSNEVVSWFRGVLVHVCWVEKKCWCPPHACHSCPIHVGYKRKAKIVLLKGTSRTEGVFF